MQSESGTKLEMRIIRGKQRINYWVPGGTVLTIIYILVLLQTQEELDSPDLLDDPSKITIAVVSCRKANDTKSNVETIVMIKSVIISALIYNVSRLEFHIFLEFESDELWFQKRVKELGYDPAVEVTLSFHYALSIVPKKYYAPMIKQHRLRCTYVRLFIPNTLVNVKAMIYLDTDALITGSIAEIWSQFAKMSDRQMVAMVANNELKETNTTKYQPLKCFRDVPYFHPRGVNAGMVLMNLTKMRAFGWEERLLRLYDDYSGRVKVEDQKLMNMLLYFNPDLLYLLPCQFNIRCAGCDHGFLCDEAVHNHFGIQVVHGVSDNFAEDGRFYHVYRFYQKFNMSTQNLTSHLIVPIRRFPEPIRVNISKKVSYQCRLPINHLMFKNLVTSQ